ncbi:hypothetical protein C8J55DRAFT_461886, partial [Lentinula edodes]
MMAEANLRPPFWKHAVAAFVEVRNCTPTAPRPNTTPSTGWNKIKPNVSPFETHSEKMIFVGYPEGGNGWLFWNLAAQRFVVSSHVVFDERRFPGDHKHVSNMFGDLFQKSPLAPLTLKPSPPTVTPTPKPLPTDTISVPVLNRGGDNNIYDSIPVPDSPLLPQIDTPPMSPLTDLPPEWHRTPDPSPPPSPPAQLDHARFEPRFRDDGLIEPLPNTGRGFPRQPT